MIIKMSFSDIASVRQWNCFKRQNEIEDEQWTVREQLEKWQKKGNEVQNCNNSVIDDE